MLAAFRHLYFYFFLSKMSTGYIAIKVTKCHCRITTRLTTWISINPFICNLLFKKRWLQLQLLGWIIINYNWITITTLLLIHVCSSRPLKPKSVSVCLINRFNGSPPARVPTFVSYRQRKDQHSGQVFDLYSIYYKLSVLSAYLKILVALRTACESLFCLIFYSFLLSELQKIIPSPEVF